MKFKEPNIITVCTIHVGLVDTSTETKGDSPTREEVDAFDTALDDIDWKSVIQKHLPPELKHLRIRVR